jgi:hypothetical protein
MVKTRVVRRLRDANIFGDIFMTSAPWCRAAWASRVGQPPPRRDQHVQAVHGSAPVPRQELGGPLAGDQRRRDDARPSSAGAGGDLRTRRRPAHGSPDPSLARATTTSEIGDLVTAEVRKLSK